MRPNQTKRLMTAGQTALGTFCTSASPMLAETLGVAGYDFVIVDLQHGENSLGNLQGMLQAVSATPATPIVRVPANHPMHIQRALDLGAYGIIVPLVNTRAEADAIMQSVRYAPAGGRSWGPLRAALYAGADYFAKSAEELLTIVMLETADGVKNAREILSVPGVDGCFIGANDLSVSLGYSAELAEYPPEVEEAILAIRDVAQAVGKAPGIQTYSASNANTRITQGFRFVSIQSDFRMVRATAAETLRAIRRTVGADS
jgi:4-hydroxy-2-oxoheptanedioate aldolase